MFIDLITICDCLDVATDKSGRNYTSEKTLDKILAELRAGAGSSYSDVLSDFICSSGKLKDELLMDKDCGQIYYDVYSMVGKMRDL